MGDRPEKPIVVGWRESVGLPDWGVKRVRAKIDTGARTSAIHVAHMDAIDDDHIRFEVVTRERPSRRTVWVEAPLLRETVIKPSSGERQQRSVVRTTMVLGGVEREIDLSLVCREGMLCRMLVGRLALDGCFLVDPSQKYLVSGRRKKSTPDGTTT